MRGFWLLGAIVALAPAQAHDACAAPASPRSESSRPARKMDDLIRITEAFLARITATAPILLPSRGRADFVEPATEAEIAWINDRSQPLDQRVGQAMRLFDATKAVVRAYVDRDVSRYASDRAHAGDSTEALVWSESAVRQYGRLADALVDELLPTVAATDTTYHARLEGLAKAGVGAFGMLQGTLITLRARRSDLEARRRLMAAWRDHAASFAKLWQPSQCSQLGTWLTEILGAEKDAVLIDSMRVVASGLSSCARAEK
jgi:hypothetical protein